MNRTIRASSLPRLTACAAAGEAPATWVEPLNDGAQLGTAFHLAIATAIKGGEPDLGGIAAQNAIDVDDLRPLYLWGLKVWREQLEPTYPNPIVEEQLRVEDPDVGLVLTGHPDVMAFAEDAEELRVVDHKSGRGYYDAEPQMRGYALLGFCRYPAAKQARMQILRLRDRSIETFVWTRQEIMVDWWGGFAAHIARADRYRAGAHCGFCPRALECPANRQQLQSTIALLSEDREQPLADTLDPLALANTVKQAKVANKRLEEFLRAAKARVIAAGGTLGPLSIKSTDKRTIIFPVAQPILVEQIGMEKLLPLLKIGKGDVEKAIKDSVGRGQKGKAVEYVWELIEGVKGFEVTTSHTLEVNSNGSASTSRAAIEE